MNNGKILLICIAAVQITKKKKIILIREKPLQTKCSRPGYWSLKKHVGLVVYEKRETDMKSRPRDEGQIKLNNFTDQPLGQENKVLTPISIAMRLLCFYGNLSSSSLPYTVHWPNPRGVLNFHFGIDVRPEGRKWGLKERVGTKNRGLKNWFFGIK